MVRDGCFQPVRQPDDQTKDRDDQQQPQREGRLDLFFLVQTRLTHWPYDQLRVFDLVVVVIAGILFVFSANGLINRL